MQQIHQLAFSGGFLRRFLGDFGAREEAKDARPNYFENINALCMRITYYALYI
jgi:hypothetical protein